MIDGLSERGGFPVTRMPLRQWVLRITEYAERLAAELETENIQWPEGTMSMQKTWIGRSEGAEISFRVDDAPAGSTPWHPLWGCCAPPPKPPAFQGAALARPPVVLGGSATQTPAQTSL